MRKGESEKMEGEKVEEENKEAPVRNAIWTSASFKSLNRGSCSIPSLYSSILQPRQLFLPDKTPHP